MTTLVAIGLSHETAPMELLERVVADPERIPKLLGDLRSRDDISEAIILSTCNRFDVIVSAERFHQAFTSVRDFISDTAHLFPEAFGDALTVRYDVDAVRYLIEVGAGMRSMVVGEHEIIGQLRHAWELARAEGVAGAELHECMQFVLEHAKRVRSTTAIGRGFTSMSQAAVEYLLEARGSLAGTRVGVVGAGSMGAAVASFAHQAGAEITVVNRTERVVTVGGESVCTRPLSSLTEVCRTHEVVIAATASVDPIVTAEMIDPATAPMLIDLGLPHNVSCEVHTRGASRIDMRDLERFAQRTIDLRASELPEARAIVDEAAEGYQALIREREVTPLVVALRGRVTELVEGEFERRSAALADLDAAQRAAVEAIVQGALHKALHEPTAQLKASAGSARGARLAQSARELFDL